MLFCQWCGKERDPDANALHYCGSKDRPAAYCIKCGKQLDEGDTECAACGTPAGQMPAPVPLVVTAPSADDAGDAQGPGPAASTPATSAPRVLAVEPAARTRPRYERDDTSTSGLRKGQAWSALAGILAFFIPWTIEGQSTGISLVTTSKWSWWNPVAPQLMFALLLIALCLTLVTGSYEGNMFDGILAVIGMALVIFCIDWVYELRQVVDYVTGFWVVMAACVFLLGSASIKFMGERSSL